VKEYSYGASASWFVIVGNLLEGWANMFIFIEFPCVCFSVLIFVCLLVCAHTCACVRILLRKIFIFTRAYIPPQGRVNPPSGNARNYWRCANSKKTNE